VATTIKKKVSKTSVCTLAKWLFGFWRKICACVARCVQLSDYTNPGKSEEEKMRPNMWRGNLKTGIKAFISVTAQWNKKYIVSMEQKYLYSFVVMEQVTNLSWNQTVICDIRDQGFHNGTQAMELV